MDHDLENKTNFSETCFECLDKNEIDHDPKNSVISVVLDIFNLKKGLELIFANQKLLKVTDNFINLILLELFLLALFIQTKTLKIEWNPITQALFLILLVLIIELAGANKMFSFLDNDTSTKKFIQELPSMPHQKIKHRSYKLHFSEECMNFFIKSVICQDKCDPDTIYNVIETQFLRKSNLDSLFSPDTLNHLHPKLIIRVLFNYQDSLTKANMLNIYKKFENSKIKDRELIIRTIFVTQRYSDFLTHEYPEDKTLSNYYIRFQIQKPIDLRPISVFVSPFKYARIANWFLVITILLNFLNDLKQADAVGIIIIVVFLWMIADVISIEMILPFVLRISKWYYAYLVHRVSKMSF
jgi:hypothetical protein